MSFLFAATYPERTRALALYGAFPVRGLRRRVPGGRSRALSSICGRDVRRRRPLGRREDPEGTGRHGTWASERAATRWPRHGRGGPELDLRPVLGAIHVPTVVVHRSDDPFPIGLARWMADRISGAHFVELRGDAHQPWRGDMDSVVDAIEEVVLAAPQEAAPDARCARSSRRIAGDRPRSYRASNSSATEGRPSRPPRTRCWLRSTVRTRCPPRPAIVPGTAAERRRATDECGLAARLGHALEVAWLGELGRPGRSSSRRARGSSWSARLAFGPHEGEHVGGANGRVAIHVLATRDGAPHPSPSDPASRCPPRTR